MARTSNVYPVIGFAAIGLALSLSVAPADAQIANPAEQQQGQSQSKDEPGKSRLGGTMPPNPGVPAMTPGAQQPASAGTTTGPDGTITRNSETPSGSATGVPASGAIPPANTRK
jgi:hypothetical protein